MAITKLACDEFLTKNRTPEDPLRSLIAEESVVYVIALTRDSCRGCQIQEPLYEKLADRVGKKHGDRVRFYSIHLSDQEGFDGKRRDFRRMLRFAAYPTYLILFKSESGTVETYGRSNLPWQTSSATSTLRQISRAGKPVRSIQT